MNKSGLIRLTPKENNTVCEIDIIDDTAVDNAIKKLGWKEKNNLIFDKKDEHVVCGICKENLKKSKITAFFPGSAKPVCEKFRCYIIALHETETKEWLFWIGFSIWFKVF